jgi:hypothetical protein
MNDKLKEIYDREIPHSSFLCEDSVMKCMTLSRELGVNDVLLWLSKMDYLSDNMEYLLDEWKNQHT